MRIEEYLWDILKGIIIPSTKKAGRREKIIRELLKEYYMSSRTELSGMRRQIHKASFAEFTRRIKEDVE